MYIIDFDGTIFDTYRFAQDRKNALVEFGIDNETFQKSYLEARNGTSGIINHSDKSHAHVLGTYGFPEEKIFEVLKNITANSGKYLFPDTLDFLNSLKINEEELILLSLGDPTFQEEKIKNSGVHDFFERVFMVADTKEHVLRELFSKVKENKIWFINDKVKETQDLVSEFKQLKPILMFSKFFKEDEYKESGLPYFKSLTEIKNYLESMV